MSFSIRKFLFGWTKRVRDSGIPISPPRFNKLQEVLYPNGDMEWFSGKPEIVLWPGVVIGVEPFNGQWMYIVRCKKRFATAVNILEKDLSPNLITKQHD